MNKLIPILAFSVLLLAPVGAQNAFAGFQQQICVGSSNLGALLANPTNCIQVDDKTFTNFRNYDSFGAVSADMIQVDGVTVDDEHGLKFTCLQQSCAVTNSPPTTTGLSISFDYDVISDGDLISDNTLTLDSFIAIETTIIPPFGFASVTVEERVYSDLGQTNEIAFKVVFGTDQTGEDLSDHIDYPSSHQSVSVDVVISLLTTGNAFAQLNEFTQTFSQTPNPLVGGELLPIDSTALLLAGAQTFSWMIPVLLSGIGIGLFVVSRKSENS